MPNKPKVVFLGPDFAFEVINARFSDDIRFVQCAPIHRHLAQEIVDAHGLIDASMKLPITHELIAITSNFRIISTATTGCDHIDKTVLSNNSIAVKTLREDEELLNNLTPAAEHTWALLLSLIRNLCGAVSHVNAGLWDREQFPGMMLEGKTLGIVGCGRLGQKVASFGKAFGMDVIGYDPYLGSWPAFIIPKTIQEVFSSSHVISIHVHVTPDTRGLISRDLLNSMKQGTFIINTSRGQIIDERALLDSLLSGQTGGAGLDVLDGEPNISKHNLVDYARNNHNLLISPHCAGYAPEAVNKVCIRAAEKVVKFFRDEASELND